MTTEIQSQSNTPSADGATPATASAWHAERGQYVYSQTHGPCLFIGTEKFYAKHPENSECRVRLLFSDSDDHEVIVPRSDLQRPIDRDAALSIIDVLRGKKQDGASLTSNGDIQPIIDRRDMDKLPDLVFRLHHRPRDPVMDAQYQIAANRVTELLTFYVLQKRVVEHKQPSAFRSYLEDMRERVTLALDGGMQDRHLRIVFGFQERDQRSLQQAIERTRAAAAAQVTTRAIIRPAPGKETAFIDTPAVPAPSESPRPSDGIQPEKRCDAAPGPVKPPLPPFYYPPNPNREPNVRTRSEPLPPHYYPGNGHGQRRPQTAES